MEKLNIDVRRHDLGGWYAEIRIGEETAMFRDPDPVAVVEKAMAWIDERGNIAVAELIEGNGLSTVYKPAETRSMSDRDFARNFPEWRVSRGERNLIATNAIMHGWVTEGKDMEELAANIREIERLAFESSQSDREVK